MLTEEEVKKIEEECKRIAQAASKRLDGVLGAEFGVLDIVHTFGQNDELLNPKTLWYGFVHNNYTVIEAPGGVCTIETWTDQDEKDTLSQELSKVFIEEIEKRLSVSLPVKKVVSDVIGHPPEEDSEFIFPDKGVQIIFDILTDKDEYRTVSITLSVELLKTFFQQQGGYVHY